MHVVDIRDKAEEAFNNYAKELLLERVFPDYRDGLAPVHRRILYGMNQLKLDYKGSKGSRHVKSARIVGEVMGKYHPHSDSGIYGALTTMAKDWLFSYPLTEVKGNLGSSDGDAPASQRYTNARLGIYSNYLLKGINKENVVDWRLTYDDEGLEPIYLPAQYPNLLVNGTLSGIAVGYAVDVLPHNLEEVLNIAIQDIKGEELDKIAPDFPTGGVIVNGKELEKMYETGHGRAIIRGQYKIETAGRRRKDKRSIVFYDLPYGVRKPKVVDKIQEMIDNNGTQTKQQLVGAVKVQDESGSEGLRIVVNVEDDADIEVITELIYKYTQLQHTQRYEFLTVLDGQPTHMSLKTYIQEFNKFRRETIIREKESDNQVIDVKVMRLDALIKLDGIRDEVIQTIRNSDNKAHAVANLVELYDYTEEQAEYLLGLQLSRLTKDNYDKYRGDREELLGIKELNLALIENKDLLDNYIIASYEQIIEDIGIPRQTKVQSEVREVDLTIENTIPIEDVVVGVTKDGHIKRSSPRSYGATKEVDFEVYELQATTHDELLVFTDKGQVGVFSVNKLPEMRWGDEGEPLMTYARDYHIDEEVIGIGIRGKLGHIIFITNDNRIKRLDEKAIDFRLTEAFYTIMPLDNEEDRVIAVTDTYDDMTIVLTSTNKRGTIDYGLAFRAKDIAPTGRNAKGRRLAQLSQYKTFEDLYLSGELDDLELYREVGRSPIREVYPTDVDLEHLNKHFTSDTFLMTNDPELEDSEESEEVSE